MKSLDSVVLERSPYHTTALIKLAEKLKLGQNETELFSESTENELKQYVEQNEDEIITQLQRIWSEGQKLESVKVPGHELSHLVDNLNSALRIFQEYGSQLKPHEQVEIILACLGHDLGRALEENLDGIDKNDTEFLVPALVWRKFSRANQIHLLSACQRLYPDPLDQALD